MNLSILALILLQVYATLGRAPLKPVTRTEMNYLLEQSQFLKNYPDLTSLFRMKRVPEVEKTRVCGEKYRSFVLGACGGSCTIASDIDLASKCCLSQCTHSDLKMYCCP